MAPPEARHLWSAWLQTSDQGAFAALVRPEVRYAVDLARRVGASADEADDVVQNALVQLAKEDSDTPLDVGLRAWLGRRVVLGVKMLIRGSVRRRRHEQRVPVRAGGRATGARVDARDETEAALARLAPQERQAIVLRYLYDLDYREMAYVLGISVGACRVRVHRAKKRLRKEYGRSAAHVALLVVPMFAGESALIGGALSAVPVAATSAALGSAAAVAGAQVGAGAAGVAVTGKALGVGAGVLAAAALTTGIVVSAEDEVPAPPPPPPIVRAAEPAPTEVRVPPALALLDDHFAGIRDASPRLWDHAAVAELIGGAPGEPAKLVARTGFARVDLEQIARTANRIEFGPGTFHITRGIDVTTGGHVSVQIGTDGMKFRSAEGGDRRAVLELIGSGAANTRLFTTDHLLHVRSKMTAVGLKVRDLTFEAQKPGGNHSGMLFDVREEGRAAATFERVTFRSWASAGYGAPVGHTGYALTAFKDCTFIGGYRTRPGGNAIAMRGPGLVLFENCQFHDMRCAISNDGSTLPERGVAHFRDCIFQNTRLTSAGLPGDRGAVDRPKFALRIRGGGAAFGWAGDATAKRKDEFRLPLAEVKGDFGFGPAPISVSLATLRKAVDLYVPPRGRRLIGVRIYTWHKAPRAAFAFSSLDKDGKPLIDLRYLDGERLAPAPAKRYELRYGDLYGHRQTEHPERPLRELLGEVWIRLDPDRAVGGIRRRISRGKESIVLYDRFGRTLR